MTCLVMHGLRRSGTTILWETLRSDSSLRCYDEPFHPRLASGARSNHKGTWTEFADLLDGTDLTPIPIQPLEELETVSPQAQRAWLIALGASHDRVVIDIVRGWNRLPDLQAGLDRAVTLHLLRDPANWVAAHLVPSGAPTFRRRVAGLYRRGSFFWRRGFYDNYQYQHIIEAALRQDHSLFAGLALSHTELRAAPAYMKLLAFWWGANRALAQALAASAGPCLTLTLADFTADPVGQVERIGAATGWDLQISTSQVRPQRDSFGATSPHWVTAAKRLGLPPEIFAHRGAEDMAAIFREAS